MSASGVLVSTGRRNTYLEQTRWSGWCVQRSVKSPRVLNCAHHGFAAMKYRSVKQWCARKAVGNYCKKHGGETVMSAIQNAR